MLEIDAERMATLSADKMFAKRESKLENQKKQISAQKADVNKLETAVTDFRSTLNRVNQRNNGLLQVKATSSDDKAINVSATAKAAKGQYDLFIEKLAKTDHLALERIDNNALKAAQGDITLSVGSLDLTIDLTAVNSIEELTNAINDASDNAKNSDGQGVSATLVRTGGEVVLTLNSHKSGAANKIDLTDLAAKISATAKKIVEGQDALVWLGAKTSGIKITHDSNILDKAIEGISIQLKQENTVVGVTVATDTEASEEQVKTFIATFNKLQQVTESSSSVSNANAINVMLNGIIKYSVDGKNIASFGIDRGRDGELLINSKRLNEVLKTDSKHFSEFFNAKDGLIDKLSDALKPYIDSTSGLLKLDNDRLARDIKSVDSDIEAIKADHKRSYEANLTKFSKINNLITKLTSTLELFKPEKEKR
ncbi:flagellar filament capping protein FliD [Yersinia pekkanenii]|uniref:Flagellar hook-associated protein 2 n=1 Tax=Yersinia pekkanenii TaxID=1288385 RepID=A0A0T9P4M5_9GAMM|nr:flagellar filament capping protein FliD [Yersinia pekkanenii]CNH44628.1 flagellar hook-associated protein 2 [Yersinia pekkanenii]CRY67663.1 flagellar hook-associated protein 2 [Yersinia pekkanenii]